MPSTVIPDKKTLKGLVDPRFISKNPLNVLFNDLKSAFEVNSKDEKDTIKRLNNKLPRISDNLAIETPQRIVLSFSAYDRSDELSQSDFRSRYQVIESCLDYLIRIKQLTMEAKIKYNAKDTLMISLHDIKLFGKLVNVIIIEGIYSALPKDIGISIEKRRMNDLRKHNASEKNFSDTLKITRLTDDSQRFRILSMIINKFLQIFTDDKQTSANINNRNNNNDVKNLLLKGVGYSDFLISSMYLIFNPKLQKDQPESWKIIFNEIEGFSNTYELFEIYSLIVGTPVQWFKSLCLFNISHLPLKRTQSGVLALIEFITGMRHNEDINMEKLDHINRILLNKPKDIPTVEYFNNLSNQMYNLLVLINRSMVTSVITNFIESLYHKNKRIVKDFYFCKVWNILSPQVLNNGKAGKNFNDGDVIVTGKDFKNGINVIYSLVKNVTDQSLVSDLLSRDLIVSLWNYILFCRSKKLQQNYTLNEIISLILNGDNLDFILEVMMVLIGNLMSGLSNYPYVFSLLYEANEESITIKKEDGAIVSQEVGLIYQSFETKEIHQFSKESLFNHINDTTDLLMELLDRIEDNESLIQKLFVKIMKKWLTNDYEENKIKRDLLSSNDEESLDFQLQMLANLKLLQAMSLKFKNEINGNESVLELLDIISTVLCNAITDGKSTNSEIGTKEEYDSDDEDFDNDDSDDSDLKKRGTVLSLSLELLASIISDNVESSFMLADVEVIDKLTEIQSRLITAKSLKIEGLQSAISSLQNAITKFQKVNYKFTKLSGGSGNDGLSTREMVMKLNKAQKTYEQDIKLYKKALKNIDCGSAPMKAFGLQSLNDLLIKKESKVVSLHESINIYLSQLSNTEPFLYLVAIKGLSNLLQNNLTVALPILLNVYTGKTEGTEKPQETYEVDTRLKVGEVLHNLITKYNSDPLYGNGKHASASFPLECTKILISTMINIVGVHENSGKSTIDNAIRMSSISIIESCFRASLNGIMQFLQDTLDIVIGILTFETGPAKETVSMRRGAIKLVHSILVSSSIKLKDVPKGYGKMILQRLSYTKEFDFDILVSEQAQQTIEDIQSVFKESLYTSS